MVHISQLPCYVGDLLNQLPATFQTSNAADYDQLAKKILIFFLKQVFQNTLANPVEGANQNTAGKLDFKWMFCQETKS